MITMPDDLSHSAVNETICRRRRNRPETKRSYLPLIALMAEEKMRSLIFGALALAVVAAGFGALISSSVAAVRNARSATFSERFAPVLDQMKKPAGVTSSAG